MKWIYKCDENELLFHKKKRNELCLFSIKIQIVYIYTKKIDCHEMNAISTKSN